MEFVLDEIECIERTLDDILHGYIPDENYNPVGIKNDGVYMDELNWSYFNLVPNMNYEQYPYNNG